MGGSLGPDESATVGGYGAARPLPAQACDGNSLQKFAIFISIKGHPIVPIAKPQKMLPNLDFEAAKNGLN